MVKVTSLKKMYWLIQEHVQKVRNKLILFRAGDAGLGFVASYCGRVYVSVLRHIYKGSREYFWIWSIEIRVPPGYGHFL